jgi:hypothetical protein
MACDQLYYEGKVIPYNNTSGIIPFAYSWVENHYEIGLGEDSFSHSTIPFKYQTSAFKNGRLWIPFKILTFWEYPLPARWSRFLEELTTILNEEYPEFEIDFQDPTWRVEVKIENDEGPAYPNKIPTEKISDTEDYKLIPFRYYRGSNLDVLARLRHLASQKDKEALKKLGYLKKTNHSKNIKWRQRLSQEKYILNFKSFLK